MLLKKERETAEDQETPFFGHNLHDLLFIDTVHKLLFTFYYSSLNQFSLSEYSLSKKSIELL